MKKRATTALTVVALFSDMRDGGESVIMLVDEACKAEQIAAEAGSGG